jgi:hypothetical protein
MNSGKTMYRKDDGTVANTWRWRYAKVSRFGGTLGPRRDWQPIAEPPRPEHDRPTLGTLRGLQSRGARSATPFIYDVDALSDAQATPARNITRVRRADGTYAYRARITRNGELVDLGYHRDYDTAAMHYDHAHGFFDWLQNRE